jgi:hypothetical protein
VIWAPGIGTSSSGSPPQSNQLSASLFAAWMDKQNPGNSYTSLLRMTPSSGNSAINKMVGNALGLGPRTTLGPGSTSFGDGVSGATSFLPDGSSATITDTDFGSLLGDAGGAGGMASLY